MSPMVEARGNKPVCSEEDAAAIVRRLREAGHVAYFAGGCVRDLLLGRAPKDFDVATDAPPGRVRQLFSNTQAVGAAFGVILVREGRSLVEVATFRTDGTYLDGRRPSSVQFTTAEQDAQRRDFTINGLFYDPIDKKVIDYVGGQADLEARILRAIGKPTERFQEDSLRLLRAVRFAARLNFTIDPVTAQAIRTDAYDLQRVSPERIGEEIRMMLTPPSRGTAWELLWTLNLLPVLFRFMPAAPHVVGEGESPFRLEEFAPGETVPLGPVMAAGAVWYQLAGGHPSERLVELFAEPSVAEAVKSLRKSLKLSNADTDALRATLGGLYQLLQDTPPTVAKMKRFLAGPQSSWSRLLLATLSNAVMSKTGILVDRAAWLFEKLAQLEKEEIAPAPLLNGEDLTAAGFSPGPIYRKLLDLVYDAQLENRIQTQEEALALARVFASSDLSR